MEGRAIAHFRILAKLGEGGMGVVYRAVDEHLQRPVALKILPPDLVADEDRRARFLREARAAAAVPHPGIATIYEVGESDGVVFIAMELVEGRTLRARLDQGPLTVKESVAIGLQIAEGIARAHQSHIVHRDLKPENVVITPPGQVKILDFGLAKLLETHPADAGFDPTRIRTMARRGATDAGTILGTTSYMSPEQARGETVDARSDIFSFGSVLYEMVTGHAPFQGRTSADILSAIIRDAPQPAGTVNPSVPQPLERIITDCLEKDPADRYQHADQLAVDLRKISRSTDAGAPVGTARSEVSGAPRRSWFAAHRLLAGVLLSLVVATGAFAWYLLRSTHALDPREGIVVADFENGTGRAVFDTAVRDAFEQLLSRSTRLTVMRGDRLKSLMGVRPEERLPALDRQTVERMCAASKCVFVAGRIEPDGSSFRLHVELFRPGSSNPLYRRSAAVASEQECLQAIHDAALDLRRAAGEPPGAVALTAAPTTRSLAAFQAYASGEIEAEDDRADVALGLHRRAVTIDPGFVEAHTGLTYDHQNLGDWRASRASAKEAYKRSTGLPEHSRLMAEILYLDATYDHAREIELLKTYRRLYPYDQAAANLLGWLYSFALEDHVAAEAHLRAAYELRPSRLYLFLLAWSLQLLNKGEELERIGQDYRTRTGAEPVVVMVNALALRNDRNALLQALDRYEKEGKLLRRDAANYRVWSHQKSGTLREALRMQEIARREDLKRGSPFDLSTPTMVWLRSRFGRPSMLSADDVARAAQSLWPLRWWAIVAVEADSAEPLASIIEKLAAMEADSPSLFVQQELGFARGCLAFVHGDLTAARRLLEPLAQDTEVRHRHHALGRLYEAQGRWSDAIAQYESVVESPNLICGAWPALCNLDRFRLAQAHERIGDTARARVWFERFAAEWKDGDPDIPELVAARQHLGALAAGANRPDR
jgi:tetratricopeptide (TPR) repeat protein